MSSIYLNLLSGTGFRNYVRNEAVPVSIKQDGLKYDLELVGFYPQSDLLKVFDFLNARTCSLLVDFLDGCWISKRNLTFRIKCFKDEMPDSASALQFIKKAFNPLNGIFQFAKMFESKYPMETCLDEQSIKLLPVEVVSDSMTVVYQVCFDSKFRLLQGVDSISIDSLINPRYFIISDDFYPLVRTINGNSGKFNLIQNGFLRLKSRNQEEAELAYLWDFDYLARDMSISKFLGYLLPLVRDSQWHSRLDFFLHPENFGFDRVSDIDTTAGVFFRYEVPNRTCSNNVYLFLGPRVSWDGLQKSLELLCDAIREKTMELIDKRRSVSYRCSTVFFSATIRDVRTIQQMQEHCFHIYSALQAFLDYCKEHIWSREESLISHLSRGLLDQIKCDPFCYTDHSYPPVKRMASSLMCGSLYGE